MKIGPLSVWTTTTQGEKPSDHFTPVDAVKAQQVAQIKVDPSDLVQFIQDGGLNPDAAPQKP